jgi:alkaline phosphatase D
MGEKFLAANPHLKLVNERRGYVVCRLTRDEMRADYRILPYVDRPGAPVSTHRSFVVEAGNPGLNPA